jgi:RimJ/RimL family protein N-acetyltransferase
MRLICGHDADIAAWTAARIPHVGEPEAFGPCVAIGVADQDRLIAGVVYHNFMPKHANVEISFASDTPRWASRGVIRALLSVPFEQYECRRISLMIPHDADRTKRFCGGLGFVREGCVREFFGARRHGEIYGMTLKDYAKLRERIG